MKKICLLVLLSVAFLTTSKAQVFITTYIESQATGNVVSDYPVWVKAIDTNGFILQYRELRTNSTGSVWDSLYFPDIVGEAEITTYDCNGQVQRLTIPVNHSPGTSLTPDTMEIPCADTGNSCTVNFTYTVDPTDSLTINFQGNAVFPGIVGSNHYYVWNFGNSNYSSQQNPAHTYTSPGSYQVILSIWEYYPGDTIVFCESEYIDTIRVGPYPEVNCQAGFDHFTSIFTDSIFFTDTSSYTGIGSATKLVSYDYGDGNVGTLNRHLYDSSGTYEVCQIIYIVENSDTLCSDVFCKMVTYEAVNECETEFSWVQINDSLVRFVRNDFVHNLPGGGSTVTSIDLGKGYSRNYGTDSSLITSYLPGVYTVCQTLKALDNLGDTICTSTYCEEITVQISDSCHADFTYSIDTASSSDSLSFTFSEDAFYHESVQPHFTWTISQGGIPDTLRGENVNYTFSNPGYFDVCMKVELLDSNSGVLCNSIECKTIQVGNNPQVICHAGFDYFEAAPIVDSIFFVDTSSYTGISGATKLVSYDYGDGHMGTLSRHLYDSAGVYQVCQFVHIVKNSDTLCSSTFCNDIVYGTPALKCETKFSWNQLNDTLVHIVKENDISYLPDGATTITTIDYGNGRSGTYGNDTSLIEFYFPGTYTACQTLVVLDVNQDTLCTSTYCDQIVTYAPDSCQADFAYSEDTVLPVNPLSYTLNEMSYYDPDLQAHFTWIISQNGNADTLTGETVNYTFPNPGDFDICMEVELLDSNQNLICSSIECKNISVSEGTGFCEASYTIDTANSSNGEVIVWNTSIPPDSDPGYQTDYIWDFGDGDTSTQAFPTHTFTEEGLYGVCLTIMSYNQYGDTCSSTYCDTLGVDSAGQLIYKKLSGFVLRVQDPESIGIVEETALETKIYPNPANDIVNVEIANPSGEDVQYVLSDMSGRFINSENLVLNKEGFTMDVSGLSPGIYILSVKNGHNISHHRLRIDN